MWLTESKSTAILFHVYFTNMHSGKQESQIPCELILIAETAVDKIQNQPSFYHCLSNYQSYSKTGND